jgi:hypothetical protein
MQKPAVGQDTDTRPPPFGSIGCGDDQEGDVAPALTLKMRAFPEVSTATQNVVVAQDTDASGALASIN